MLSTFKNKDKTFKGIKMGIRLVTTTLVEIFMGALTNSVISDVRGGKMAKLGAKAGGFLVGMYLGDEVANYICDDFDEALSDLEEIEARTESEDED